MWYYDEHFTQSIIKWETIVAALERKEIREIKTIKKLMFNLTIAKVDF